VAAADPATLVFLPTGPDEYPLRPAEAGQGARAEFVVLAVSGREVCSIFLDCLVVGSQAFASPPSSLAISVMREETTLAGRDGRFVADWSSLALGAAGGSPESGMMSV